MTPAGGRSRVLVVDDELRSQEAIARALEDEADVWTASGAEEALAIMEREPIEVVLCDQRMPGITGVEFLRLTRERWPDTVRIIISAYTDADDMIAGINEGGIYQYIVKPWRPDALALAVRSAATLHRLQRENHRLSVDLRASDATLSRRVGEKRVALRREYDFGRLARAPGSPLEAVIADARRIAHFDIPVLVTGESGTGKELLARAIHFASPRADRPFVVENCAAVPTELIESELFGHKRGSFTGAYEDRTGVLAQADGGTLFLDEIGETSPAFQVKLLRALQEGEIRPVGANRSLTIDVRIIAATNRDLEADVRAGRFREDLYYRLAGMSLRMPPLRERPGDIHAIADRILEHAMAALGKRVEGFAEDARVALAAHDWPGNVRELANEIQRMLALADGPLLGASLLSPRARAATLPPNDAPRAGADGGLRSRVESLEATVLREVLARHGWNKTKAAAELGLSRVGLRAKLARYGLDGGDDTRRPRRGKSARGKGSLFAVK